MQRWNFEKFPEMKCARFQRHVGKSIIWYDLNGSIADSEIIDAM
jgi:hypothetical protein